ncbi:MAG: filamentous hemagglutinin N-terminal domain-containing protein, partial [Gammaproteobacteria bacterium]|nr:filamentous hemagglutinin N-terminal domain-containing protein [Gammaproteobacteria bacterium]
MPTNTAETQVFTVNNVPVVDIARPTPSGVSKNQFNDFDVDSAGVVINNSLVNGTSRLAGGLGANANFNDKSARIILNEVVTTNTSDINGMTELFGDNASYILSNPNGISCNGCGFIRT